MSQNPEITARSSHRHARVVSPMAAYTLAMAYRSAADRYCHKQQDKYKANCLMRDQSDHASHRKQRDD